MQKFLMFLCAVTLVFGMVGAASAIPYSKIQTPGEWILEGESYEWSYDLTDYGFDPLTQDVTFASIGFLGAWAKAVGSYEPLLGGLSVFGAGDSSFSWEKDGFSISLLMMVDDSGIVDAILSASKGDFFLGVVGLFASATSPSATNPVPEPATILLMGSGILGLVAYGRKRRKRHNRA
jgi:hypothetical protein